MAITYVSAANFPFGVSPLTVLAGAYESRATQIARLFVPLASFAGDTAQTLTDGSFNSNNASVLKSSSAVLASPSNIRSADNDIDTNNDGDNTDATDENDGTSGATGATGFNPVTAKPLIIKVKRDEFTGEIVAYGVFNADGTVPGQPRGAAGAPLYTPGQDGDPFLTPDPVTGAPFAGVPPRYLVDRMTGQIYLNNQAGITGVNLDGAPNAEIVSDTAGTDNVVGIVEFKALEGAALSTAQQRANELSNVIQSLSTLIRGFKDAERSILNALR
ncbi:MAG: hypothetical protein ACO1RX_04235 [Candidatus Sericytochromatia bacterium]